MEHEVLYKKNPTIEAKKRLNMTYLLLKNPQMIETIQKSGAAFFHGTNANALPNILKYGINSVDESRKNNIDVTTGEEWSRINGNRKFISLTDCLDVALSYAAISPKDNNPNNSLLNFGVVVGASLEDMKNLRVFGVGSDISEVGVMGKLPIEHIKFLAVPDDKVEFVKKMVGQKEIDVVSMDMKDIFFNNDFKTKLEILEKDKENTDSVEQPYPTYLNEDVKPVVNERKKLGIKSFFNTLKERWNSKSDKNIGGRG